jgi:hypothetical protein
VDIGVGIPDRLLWTHPIRGEEPVGDVGKWEARIIRLWNEASHRRTMGPTP